MFENHWPFRRPLGRPFHRPCKNQKQNAKLPKHHPANIASTRKRSCCQYCTLLGTRMSQRWKPAVVTTSSITSRSGEPRFSPVPPAVFRHDHPLQYSLSSASLTTLMSTLFIFGPHSTMFRNMIPSMFGRTVFHFVLH